MAKLTWGDLSKSSKSGGTRGLVLLEKIQKSIELETDKGKAIITAPAEFLKLLKKEDYSGIQKQYQKSGKQGKFLTAILKNGKIENMSVTNLMKTKDFGSSGGSGAGAAMTKLGESAQCLYAALLFYILKKEISPEQEISKDDLKKALRYTDTDETETNLLTKVPEDWVKSSISGANSLFHLYFKKNTTKKYTFHRGSKFITRIEKTFTKINSKEKAFGNLNKWTPADMYVVSKEGEKALFDSNTIGELNSKIFTLYLSGDLIGVSLKKIVGKKRGSIDYLNIDKKVEATFIESKGVKYRGMRGHSTRGTMFDGIDVYLQWGNGSTDSIQFRSFAGDTLTGWQGEVKGAHASQGKISLGPLSYILRQNGINMPTSADSADLARSMPAGYFKDFHMMVKKLKLIDATLDVMEFEGIIKALSPKWRYSKYLGIKLMYELSKIKDQKKLNTLVEDVYLYASSRTRYSAPYIKLS